MLQIIDAATWRALETLSAAGMISIHTRATRPLLPAKDRPVAPPPTPEQLARVDALHALAARKRRAARALLAAGLGEEAEGLDRSAAEAEAEAETLLAEAPAAMRERTVSSASPIAAG